MLLRCLIVVVYTITFITSYPATNKKGRGRRQIYANAAPSFMDMGDARLMKEAWDSPVDIGFFINPKGEGGEPDSGSQRSRIMSEEGSGTLEHRRDEILQKPGPINNDKENELTSEMKSKVEKSDEIEDPGDKKKVRSSITCEGRKEWIQCDGPYELIKIQEAFWGRDDSKTCTKDTSVIGGLITDKNCIQDEKNTLLKAREACDNENVCEIVASDIYFDQTDCPNIHKYLKLKWQCSPSESRIKTN